MQPEKERLCHSPHAIDCCNMGAVDRVLSGSIHIRERHSMPLPLFILIGENMIGH
jgi:hypothetical protein